MSEQDTFEALGQLTKEMFLNLSKRESSMMIDQLIAYHELASNNLNELLSELSKCQCGELLNEQKRALQILFDDFLELKADIGSKYKIYLRGCGNAGKSTLLNALLCLDETNGSRMGRLPMTFTIDTYVEELSQKEAEVIMIDENGTRNTLRTSRDEAIKIETKEENEFKKSKEYCEELIEQQLEHVFLGLEKENIKNDIYRENLMRTSIREVRWGIGQNDFFHNCILIDTPGLSQDLRFTNVLEEIKEYEIDGIVWVISTESFLKEEVLDKYQEEINEFSKIYANGKVIAVINMYGETEDYRKDSRLWCRIKKKAEEIYLETFGFDEVICVNAKLAYEGSNEGNQDKIAESNIEELRTMTNQLFVERTSEDYQQDKLDKVETFLNNLYQFIKDTNEKLQDKIQAYKDRKAKILNLSSSCKGLLQPELRKIISSHLAEVRNNIDANLSTIQQLESETKAHQAYFINNEIAKTKELEDKVNMLVGKYETIVFERFRDQRTLCVMSNYCTSDYAMRQFSRIKGDFDRNQSNNKIAISIGNSVLLDFIADIFGKDSFLLNVYKSFRDFMQSPKDRLYKNINKGISEWMISVSINDEIEEYKNWFLDSLNTSMEYSCGAYKDVEHLYSFINKFIEKQPHMEWKQVKLFDLLGE